jgi:CRP-like cAMP-binding protein
MNVVERVSVLRQVELFAGAPGRMLAGVAAVAVEVDVPEDALVLEQGDLGHTLYVVLEGDMAVEVNGQVIATLGPGAVVGELAILVPEARSATVRALSPGRLLSIDKSAVDELLLDHPEVANSVIVALVRRIQEQNRRPMNPRD